jgi:hypothetical protein
LRAAIQAVAREGFGSGVGERPIPGLSTVPRDVEPLAGLRAAVLARDVAARYVRDYVLTARADGHSWEVIAEALGVKQVEGSVSRSERAYLHVVEDRPLYSEDSDQSWGRSAPAAHWRCGSCDQYVSEHGPFEAAPYNAENGHDPACTRHTREIAAYETEWGQEP